MGHTEQNNIAHCVMGFFVALALSPSVSSYSKNTSKLKSSHKRCVGLSMMSLSAERAMLLLLPLMLLSKWKGETA